MRIMRPLYCKNEKFNKTNSKGPSFSYEVLNNGFGNFLRKFDFEADLHKISCETLILVGESDWVNDPTHLQKAYNEIEDAQLNILKDCGHFVAIDRHEEYIKLIKEFIKD